MLRLDADHLDLRLQRSHRLRDPGDHAAAADRHHDRVDIRDLLQDFERDSALPGDDRGVIVAMDIREAPLFGERIGMGTSLGRLSPWRTTFAPSLRQLATLISGAKRGITTVTGIPSKPP